MVKNIDYYGNETELVSVCLITYNQEQFINEALQGIIGQDYKNFEIIISDDKSTDKTYNIIEKFYKKYKNLFRIKINKNPTNLGIAGNVNKVLELCSGKYIVLCAGDDVPLPNRIESSINKIKEVDALSVTFNSYVIDSNSKVLQLLIKDNISNNLFKSKDLIRSNIISNGSTRIINRKLIDIFGYLNNDCPTEDSVFNLRAILTGGLAFCNIPVAYYRVHENNISSKENLILKFDPDKIYNQYLKDLKTAYQRNLITDIEYQTLKKYLFHKNIFEREKRYLYTSKSFKVKIFTLAKIAFSSKYTIKEKLILFKISLH